jgi:uncharacterized protein (TIGR02246 family)
METRVQTDTRAVLDHHLGAFGAGDTDEVLKDFTEDSVVIGPDAVHKGREAIRAVFSGFFSGLFKPGTYEIALDAQQVEGDVAYIVWHADCASATIPLATDTFVVRDGKIATQTFAAKIDPR